MASGGDLPPLCADLPSISDVQLNVKQPELPVDILLLTIEDFEFLACYQQLKDPFRWYFHGLGYVYFEDMDKGRKDGLKVSLMNCCSSVIGPGGSLITVRNAAKVLRPKAVISVGTCCGLNSKKTKLGDIVVSSKLRTCASKEVTEHQAQSSGNCYVNRHFCDVIKNCADGWKAPLKNSEAREVKVHLGEVLSGPEVFRHESRHKQLAELYPEAVAFEMEGEGIFAAAFDLQIEWLIVKGISHFGDSAQLNVKSWQAFASVMAASLVAHILSDPCIFRSWPHFKEPSSELLAKFISIPKESGEQLEAIIRGLEWQDTEKRMGEESSLKDCVMPDLGGINLSVKNFKILVQRVWNSSKHWSACQSEFIVFTCQGNGDFNLMNCLAILSLFAFEKVATKSLEVIQTLAGQYEHYPGFGVVINNLGVMFTEKSLFEKSTECFVMAKSCFDLQEDHLRGAAVSLNQAVLYKAVGDYKKARSLCSEIAAVYCHKFEITEKNVHLLVKVLVRAADMLKEIEDYVMFYKFLKICARFDFAGASMPMSVVLAGQLMKLQLKEETSGNVVSKEVTAFSHNLLMLLDNPDAELMNADVIRIMINAAKIHRKNGCPDEAGSLLIKLQNSFLFVHGGKASLYGFLLYQIGCFFIACEKFSEALIALRQAMNILISYFGQEHHTVASCMSMLGSCFLLMGNYKEALKHLNEALAKFTNLNPNHPEAGRILLELSFLKIEEKNFQCACDTMEEALGIFISACGELSPMLATGYFQSATILLKDKSLWNLAREKLVTAVDIFLHLGLKSHHSFVNACHSLLGVLKLSLRDREEAEKSFEAVEQQLDINSEFWIKSRIIYSRLVNLLVPSLAVDLDRSFDFCAKVVALVNLVHLNTGNERYRHLDLLINYLERHKTEELQIKDFAGQDVCLILHRLLVSDKPVVCIVSSHPKPASPESVEQLCNHPVSDTKEADEQSEWSQVFLSSVNTKYFVLCLRVPHNIQEDGSFLASALKKSVLTLFLQPSFRKDFVERDDLYREMTIPTLNICFLWRLIDCLPLLVELELSELQECDTFNYLNSWESSLKSRKQSIQVSYLSSECSNQREAEFVFDRLTQKLHEKLTLSTDLGVVVSHVSPAQNVASLVIEKLGKSFISIAVEKKFLTVKCYSFKESDLEHVCSLVQEALENTMESSAFSVKFEQSSWLLGQRSCCELSRENCSSDVGGGLFRSDSTLERSDSPCADSRDPQSDVDVLQGVDVENRPIVSHTSSNLPTDVDINLCLLEYLLRQAKCEATTEKTLLSSNVTSCSSDSCASDVQVNQNSPVPSEQTSVSENNSSFPESDDSFTPRKSLPDSLTSVRSIKETNGHLSLDQSDSEVSTYRHLSNEEGIVKSSCGPDTREAKQLKDSHQLQSSTAECNSVSSEENSLFPADQKTGMQHVHTNRESNVANSSMLLLNNQAGHLDLYQHQKQGPSVERHESISRPSSAASSEGSGLETASGDFENVLAASQKECFELQLEIKQLEEQLKQSEEEKQKLQVDLGKHLFLEEKGKRCGRLLGGAALLHESGYSLHSRLLEISDSLSLEEVKKIKFLVKSKVSGFRLARITEAFELFEELETNGVFPCHYIANLLAGIQRYDLVEKLGIQLPLTAAKHGSDILSGQSLSASGNRLPDHVENSSRLTSVKDYSLEVQLNRHGRKHVEGNGVFTRVSIRGDSMQLQGVEENDKSLITEEAETEQENNSSIGFSENSRETNTYTAVSSESEEGSNSSMKSALSAEEFPQFPTLTSDDYLSSSNDSSLLSSSFEQTAVVADSSCTLQSTIDTTDGSPILTTPSSKACRNKEISVDTDPNVVCTKEQTERSSKFHYADVECDGSPIVAACQSYSAYSYSENNECYVADGEDELFDKAAEKSEWKEIEEEKEFVDSCDGAIKPVYSGTSADTFVGEIVGTQSFASGGILPLTQQGTSSTAERVLGTQSSAETDWERLGARPKEVQRSDVQPKPTEPVVYITDGLAGDFLARHTQDKSLHDSIYQTDGASLFNDFPSQGTSFIDGDISRSSRAQAYFGDCQVASRAEPFIGTGNSLVSGSNGHLGGPSNAELFTDNLFSLHSNYLSRNTSTAANSYSPQSDFVHSSHRFAGVDHFDGQTYFPSAQQMPYPPMASDPVLNSYPGMTGSSCADPSRTGTALTLPGDPVYNAPRFDNFSSEQLTGPAHDTNRFAGDDNASAFTSDQGTDEPAQKTNLAFGNSRTTTGNIDDDANSAARYQLGTSTTSDGVLAARSTHDTSVLEPRHGDTDNNRVSVLNNTDFGTDSIEASDNSLLALERRVAEACALVERVLREREEREQFGREIERKEQLIREQRARERREREERELREAENWPQQQEAINARSQWLCEHYQRHCRVRFPCCTQFYPCHRCHNISKACDNEEAKACHATHLKCSHCQHEQEIGEDSAKCRKCGGKMSAYFCAICKHFTSVDKNPYHCEKCGICRIHQDKSFHCEVCNVCLDKRLEGNHKCRPDSGHDECCICLEDAFSGCQILPCSHKVHRECAIAMIQNGIRTCPICRHPLYSQSRE